MKRSTTFPVVIPTEKLTIEGKSRAGNETYFRVRELGVALDIGRCPDALVGIPHIFVTHSHLDHALGVPYYAAQRRLQRLPPGSVYVPAESAAGFAELMRVHEALEATRYELNLVGVEPGGSVDIRRNLTVRAHRSTHRVPANSWEFVERRHKLRPQYASLPDHEIAALHRAGAPLEEQVWHSLLFYTGDTDRGILEQNDAIFRSDVLVMECSFAAPNHRDRAALYRHIHIEDLYDFADRFENEAIVLTHFSLRYEPSEIHRMIAARCPASLRGRIRLALPEPWVRLE